MRKWIVCMVISLLVFISAFILPVGAGISLLLIVVGALAAMFFGFKFIATRGVVPEIEGGGMSSKDYHYKNTVVEKQETESIWDAITEKDLDSNPQE